MHPMVLLGDEAQVEARFSPFGDVLILTQDRCTIYAERNIGSAIILDAPDGTPRGRGSWRVLFRSVWSGVNVGAR
jgi:hypothetical protein